VDPDGELSFYTPQGIECLLGKSVRI
jgi:hypothetical protein